MIKGAELVESYFGYWPEFCDAKITSILYEAHSSLVIGLSYIDSDLEKAADVQLKFVGVTDVDLTDLQSENVVDALQISGEAPITVSLEACCGLDGDFKCQAVEISVLQTRAAPRPY